MIKVAICIITYQRPQGLRQLLEGLTQLTFQKSLAPELEIIVIDNDAHPAIRSLCHQVVESNQLKVIYGVETQRGITFARNKAVATVQETTDFIVFIDDDEYPDATWLDELLFIQSYYAADIVAGPVLPILPSSVPDWMVTGKFFERPRYASGTKLTGAATNNVLIRANLLLTMDKVFDDRWALSGGEDWHLFKRLHNSGCSIVWANEAVVYESIPSSRANLAWLLQRSYSHGNTESLCEITLNPSWKTSLSCFFRGTRRMLRGILWMPFCVFAQRHVMARNLRYLYHSLGLIAGVIGRNYEEYKQVHRV